jgi:hypothetical protein
MNKDEVNVPVETGTHTAVHSPRYTFERDRCGSWLWIFRDNRPFIKFMKGTEGEVRKVADFLNGGGIEWRPKVQDVTVSPTTASRKSEARVRATAVKSVEYSRPDSASLTAEELQPLFMAMVEAAPIVRFYLKRESEAPANHDEMRLEAEDRLRKFERAFAKLQDACSLPGIKVVRDNNAK